MYRSLLIVLALAGSAAATPMSYMMTGTGTGVWGSQSFSNASFTFTFNSDTTAIVHGTSCCASIYTTPSGTTASVTIGGLGTASLTADQAIFVDQGADTAGIWHYNAAQFLTVTNTALATYNLSTPIAPQTVGGMPFSYATPISLSTGGSLYFTSVSNVFFSAQSGSSGGQPSAVSVSPSSGTLSAGATQTYTFTVSDTAGVLDLKGADILFEDPQTSSNFYACWLFYQASSNTLSVNNQGTWSTPVPVGSGGSVLTGNSCTVNTASVTVAGSANNLVITAPITMTSGDNSNWPILLDAINNESVDSGYQQVGTVTMQGAPSGYTLSVTPTGQQGVVAGSSIQYNINLAAFGGFNEPVTLSDSSSPDGLSFSFNPSTITGSGTSVLTISTTSSTAPGFYTWEAAGTPGGHTTSPNTLYVGNGPPTGVTLSPFSGTGSSQTFTVKWPDGSAVSSLNLLVATSVSGQNSCWIFFDTLGARLYLASDDGSSWTFAGQAVFDNGFGGGTGPGASNSQCSITGTTASYDADSGFGNGVHSGFSSLTLPITFTPAFAGPKTTYVDASNPAGQSTGYVALGTWTVQ